MPSPPADSAAPTLATPSPAPPPWRYYRFSSREPAGKANQLGDTLRQGLLAIAEDHPEVGDVRGLGAMIAIELFEEGDRSKPNARLTADIVARARDKGLILLSCGPYYNVLRILVPLTIEEAQIEQGLKIIADCFTEAKQA